MGDQGQPPPSRPPLMPPLASPSQTLSYADIILLHACLVFFMQVGFVSLELGFGRSKNVKNVMLKNIVNILLCALSWWLVGYGIENGSSNKFIGTSGFLGNGEGRGWFFTFGFALATVSIISGCLAERTNLIAYPILTIVTSCWIHPVVAHWAWVSSSWLQSVSDCDFLDFAGGAVVHATGGVIGLVGALLCGPRLGRFEDGKAMPMPGHDVSQVAMGTLLLWFGWFGFNCGSVYLQPKIPSNTGAYVDRVAMNMTLAASSAGIAPLLLTSFMTGTFDLVTCCNGILAGLVAATSSCGYVDPWSSLFIGLVAGLAYLGTSRLMLYLQVDDPLDSTSVHFSAGVIGTLLNGIFAKPSYVSSLTNSQCGGLIYSWTGGKQMGMQFLGVVVTIAWATFFSLATFLPLRHFKRLRVEQITELAGIDNIDHGGPAYPEFTIGLSNQDRSEA